MANIGSWNKNAPLGSEPVRSGDDLMRSHWSVLQGALEDEHYFTDGSSASAGQHKRGSARVHVGTSSQVSTVADDGRLMWTVDDERLHVLSSTSTVALPSLSHANTWSAPQSFASTLSVGGHLSANSGVSVAGGLNADFLSLNSTTPITGIIVEEVTWSTGTIAAGTQWQTQIVPSLITQGDILLPPADVAAAIHTGARLTATPVGPMGVYLMLSVRTGDPAWSAQTINISLVALRTS